MTTLTEFLLARIAEDEERARLLRDNAVLHLGGPFDPARVLAECEAKRRIVELHSTYAEAYAEAYPDSQITVSMPWACVGCGFTSEEEFRVEHVNQCPTLRALALPYADHPDFDPAWKD